MATSIPPGHSPRLKNSFLNSDFMESFDARGIRILCEYVEPYTRFRRLNVKHTIVFFGSARIRSLADAQAQAEHIRNGHPSGAHSEEVQKEMKERADRAVHMARYYDDTAELAKRLTEWSLENRKPSRRFYVCSGGGPGIMEAANRGAMEAGGRSIGLNISLPMEQMPNSYQSEELSFEFHYFFMRKFWFVYLAKALVIMPGGFGTMDEMFELLTMVQTEKTRKYMPILLYGSEFWKEVIDWEAMAKWGVIDIDDLSLFRFCDDVDSAFKYLTEELTRIYPPAESKHR